MQFHLSPGFDRLRSTAALHPTRTRAILATAFLLAATCALSQRPANRTEQFRRMSEDAERKGLADPFKGITRNGQIESGLFKIHSTGVSTEPVRKAAEIGRAHV